jgi:ribonuclease Z
VTDLIGDHIFGLIPLLASCLNGAGGTSDGVDDPRTQVDMDQQVFVSDVFSVLRILIYYSHSRSMAHSEPAPMSAVA